ISGSGSIAPNGNIINGAPERDTKWASAVFIAATTASGGTTGVETDPNNYFGGVPSAEWLNASNAPKWQNILERLPQGTVLQGHGIRWNDDLLSGESRNT